MQKNFYGWIKLKEHLHYSNKLRAIKNGDIWWCAVGENVGAEINGKSETFARPVLILRKLSQYNFIGIPLTSKEHEGSWYSTFYFKGKKEIAVLSQIKNISVSRLYKKIGAIPEPDLMTIRNRLCGLILGKNVP